MSQYAPIMATKKSSTPPDYLLDMKRALEFVGDEEGVYAMMPMLLDSLRNDVPSILNLLKAGDAKAANKLLHPLKGFVPVFCVDYVVDRVTEVEVLSKTAAATEVLPRYVAVMPLLERLRVEVEAAVPPDWSNTLPPAA
ncbi:MAG: hypothetical protein RL014_2205 [Pseudomonadota bacterium]|jgi:hypothetical protein